jgi:hypothetical protein
MVASVIFGPTWQFGVVFAVGASAIAWGAYSFNRKCRSLRGRMHAFFIYQAAIAGTVSAAGMIVLECLHTPVLPLPFGSPAWRVGVVAVVLIIVVFGPLRWARRRVQKLASIAEYAAVVDFEFGCREPPEESQSHDIEKEESP